MLHSFLAHSNIYIYIYIYIVKPLPNFAGFTQIMCWFTRNLPKSAVFWQNQEEIWLIFTEFMKIRYVPYWFVQNFHSSALDNKLSFLLSILSVYLLSISLLPHAHSWTFTELRDSWGGFFEPLCGWPCLSHGERSVSSSFCLRGTS